MYIFVYYGHLDFELNVIINCVDNFAALLLLHAVSVLYRDHWKFCNVYVPKPSYLTYTDTHIHSHTLISLLGRKVKLSVHRDPTAL